MSSRVRLYIGSAAAVGLVLTVLALVAWAVRSDGTSTGQDANTGATSAPTARSNHTPVTSSTDTSTPQGAAPAGEDSRSTSAADVDAVADAFAAAMVEVDAASDATPAAAVQRAARWATPALAEQLQAAQVTSGATWWTELLEHAGATTARVEAVEDSGQPTDTDTTAYRVRWVERIPAAPDGWEGEPYGQTLFITLTRTETSNGWLVSDVTAG